MPLQTSARSRSIDGEVFQIGNTFIGSVGPDGRLAVGKAGCASRALNRRTHVDS